MSLPAWRPVAAFLLTLLGLAALVAARATGADAAPTAIATGSLDWGVKQSFRSYVTGPIAHGSIEVADGATTNPNGTFDFPLTSGGFDPDSGATVVAFGGSVRFRGHDGQLDMKITDVRVEIAPDGARLLADVASAPFPAGGTPVVYPDTELAALDVSGVDPVVGGPTTSWDSVPATLTPAGAPAFGGFYAAGTALDPVTFAYDGPGGKPIAEAWADPGTPHFADVGHADGLGGFSFLAVDAANGVIHAATSLGLRAFDLETFAPVAALDVTGLEQIGWAFDPETGTLFARKASGDVLTYAYDGAGSYVPGEVAGVPGARTLIYDPTIDRLYSIATPPPSPTFAGPPAVTVATRDGAGWDVADYGTIDTASRNVGSVALSSTGTLVASYAGLLVGGAIQTQPTVTLADTGSALVATEVTGTAASAPPGGGMTTGWANPTAGPAGTVALYETTIGSPAGRVLTLAPSAGDPSGYAVEGEPLDVGAGIRGVAFDAGDGSQYLAKDTTILVRRDGAPYATIAGTEGVVRMVAGDGTVYAGSNATGVLTAYRQVGVSPTIDEQPAAASVQLAGEGATQPVTFTAAASGEPAPAVRWQHRSPGATGWEDLPGETQPTLTVEATASLAGERYRAVFANVAGELATAAATLSVVVLASGADPGPPSEPGPPSDPAPPASPPAGPAGPSVVAPRPPRVEGVRAKVSLGGDRTAAIATLRCPAAGCRIGVPDSAPLKIGRTTFRVKVLAPKALRAGGRATVRIRLGRKAAAALAGRSATLKLTIAIRAGGKRVERRVSVTIRGKRQAAATR